MKISLLVNYFPPEIGSASDLFYQLAMAFHEKGHDVKVFTISPRFYNMVDSCRHYLFGKSLKQENMLWGKEEIFPNFNIFRLKLLPLIYPKSGNSAFFRGLEHTFQPLVFMSVIKKMASSDMILVYSPPLVLGYIGTIIGKLLNVPTVINVQDIHPAAIVDLGLLKNSSIISFFENLERKMYKQANAIVVHSNGNRDIVIKHSADPWKVSTIPNACNMPSDKLLQEGGTFKRKLSLNNRFVVTYAGIMSYSQDLETILLAAKLLMGDLKDIVFLLAGNGPQRPSLECTREELGIRNVLFLPFQEGENYWRLLSASDACLVPLKKSKVKTPVIPRKLEDIMAAGKPVIANVPLDGDVKKLVEGINCGMVVESENPEQLAKAIREIYQMDKETQLKYGSNGRLFAEQNFTPKAVAIQYEAVFASLC